MDRYKQQRVIIQQIVKEFEDPSYKDDDPEKSTKVLGLMNQVSASSACSALTSLTERRRCKHLDHHPRRSWGIYRKVS